MINKLIQLLISNYDIVFFDFLYLPIYHSIIYLQCISNKIQKMQLSKLRKNSVKIFKRLEKLKCLALGTIVPNATTLTPEQLANKMIDSDSCIHQSNSSQVLLTQFQLQPPRQTNHKKSNKLYSYFVRKVNKPQQSQNETKGQHIQQTEQKNRLANSTSTKFRNHSKAKTKVQLAEQYMMMIYEQADKRHEIKKFKIRKIERDTEKLYKQCHESFVELMHIKKQREKDNSVQENEEETDIRSKNTFKNIQFLNKKIAALKMMIQKKQSELEKLMEDERNLNQQKCRFLKLLLKNGYHQSDGIHWILVKLAKNKQNIYTPDLYDSLDNKTKQYIIEQYQLIKSHINKKNKFLPNFQKIEEKIDSKNQSLTFSKSNPILGYQRLLNIPRNDKRINIYNSTKKYLVDWVKQQRWKVRSLKHRTEEGKNFEIGSDWKFQQLNRLKKLYSREEFERMAKYIFGSTKHINRFYSQKMEEERERRKDSLKSFTSHTSTVVRSNTRKSSNMREHLIINKKINK